MRQRNDYTKNLKQQWGITCTSPKEKCIYCIRDCNNNIMYIGSTEDVYSRTTVYYNKGSILSRIRRQPTQKVYQWCLDNFETYNVEIMMFCNNMSEQQLVELEVMLTEYYDPELNIRAGNKGTSNMGVESKAVRCIETEVVYESIREAERITGISRHTISRAARGKIHTAGGYHWQFV